MAGCWDIDFSSLGGRDGRRAVPGPLAPGDCAAVQAQVLVPPALPWWSRKLQTLAASAYAWAPEWFRLGLSTALLKLHGRSHGRGVGHCPRVLPDPLLVRLSRAVGGGPAVLLSHDVDYTSCYRTVLDLGAREANHGVRATYYFLTRASYRLERPVLRELRQMGHEVALHGYTYDLRLAFRSRAAFRARITRARQSLEDLLGEAVHGYRNHGMLLFWPPMLESLEALGFVYESSLYPSGELNAVNRWYCWPFRYRNRNLWSIPVAWPEDSDAFRVRGLDDDEALEYYGWTLSVLTSLGGAACFSFHPCIVSKHIGFFARFLEAVRDSRLPNPTAIELVRWAQGATSLAG